MTRALAAIWKSGHVQQNNGSKSWAAFSKVVIRVQRTTGSTNSVITSNLQAEFCAFKAQQLIMNKEVKENRCNLGDAMNMLVSGDASTLGELSHTITIGGGSTHHTDFIGMIAKNTVEIIVALCGTNCKNGIGTQKHNYNYNYNTKRSH